jgi:hypothetical protein
MPNKKPIRNRVSKKNLLLVEALEVREVLTAFTPGDLVILQAGTAATTGQTTGALFLDEVTTAGTPAAANQSVAIPNTQTVGGPGNQPITIDLSAAAGNGQLNRSYDGSVLTFGGIDAGLNNPLDASNKNTVATGSADRVIAVAGNDPAAAGFLDTTTHGQVYVGDDNRGAVAESATGPIWTVGHPNQAGGAVSQGVHYFPALGPSIGTQVSAGGNIRGATIGFDNRFYFSTAGSTSTGLAGIYTEGQALPTNANPASDFQVVPALFTASKLGGIFLADMNGDGVIDDGDRLYFLDDGTVGGAGTGGLYVSTWNSAITTNPWNNSTGPVINHWSLPVRLGDAPAQDTNVGNMRGIAGTVISPTEADLYTTAFDNKANHSSYVQKWVDTGLGVAVAKAEITSGTTVQITTLTPNTFTEGQTVVIDGVGSTTGAGALTNGYNGSWVIHVIDSTHFTYTDSNAGATTLATVTNQGSADVALVGANNNAPATIITQANGSLTIGGNNYATIGLRGIAFAPVAPTAVNLTFSPPNPENPGTAVTFTATLTNPEVTPTGVVSFLDLNTGTVLGSGTISTTAGVTTAQFTTTLVGNHFISAYFAGGGAAALASAKSNTVQVTEAGSTASTTTLTSSLPSVAAGRQVTLTATVAGSGAPTGTVNFYNGSVGFGNLLGSAPLSTVGGSQQAVLTTSLGNVGSQAIIAVYNGSDTFASSQATQTVTVTANATAAITASATGVAVGDTPTYTATISGNATLGSPLGTVQFFLDGVALGSAQTLTAAANNTSTASIASTALTAGSHFITIAYTPTDAASPFVGFAVDTITSANGVALIETAKKAFTPGDLIVVQRGDGNVNLGSSGYLVFLDEYTTGGTLVQRIALPNVDNGSTHGLLLSGQNGAEGLLNRSANGSYLTIAGYDLPVGRQFVTSTFPFQYPRTIARIDNSGSLDTSTSVATTAPTSVPYNPLDVVSNDGNEFWIASNLNTGNNTDSGLEYVGSLGATSATQIGPAGTSGAAIGIAGGQLYAATSDLNNGTPADVWQIGTGLPTTAGQTLATLPGLQDAYNAAFAPDAPNPEQLLFLNHNDGTSNNPDTLFIADQAHGLLKFSFDGTKWSYQGQKLVFAGGATGVAGTVINPGANAQFQLYVTGSNVQGQNPNQIDSFLDTNAFNAPFVGGNFTKVSFVGGSNPASPNGNMNFAGIAFAPLPMATTTVSVSPAQSNAGQAVTLTASVAGSGTPTGTVQFFSNGVPFGTPAALNSSGVATLVTTTLKGGSITAEYGGDTVNGGSTSAPATAAVVQFTPGDLVVSRVGTGTASLSSAATPVFIDQYTPAGASTGVSVALPTVGSTAAISSATESSSTVTATTTAPHGFSAGQVVVITGASISGYNGTFTIAAVPTSTTFTYTAASGLADASGGTATVSTNSLTLAGTTTSEGYLTDSADGHILAVGGYNQVPGGSTSGVNRVIGTVSPLGTINVATNFPSANGSARAVVSADGLGFFIATGNGVRYVPFGNPASSSSTQLSTLVSSPTADLISPSGQLYIDGGAGAQANGFPAIDGPASVGTGLPTVGGQSVSVLQGLPTATDANGKFPTSNQFVFSPDGNTLYIADSRTDAFGGILKYFQSTPGQWTFLYRLQLDSFAISSATESGTTVTITTTDPHDFTVGEKVEVDGVLVSGYNGTQTITAVTADTFSYKVNNAGLADSGKGSATSSDGGLRGLIADFSNPSSPVLYGTTTNTTGNRIVKFVDNGDLSGNGTSFTATTLATAPANEAFRGVAFAPTLAGTTASATSLAVSGSPAAYGAGVTLTATVTTGATGWVSFQQNGVEIGAAPIINGTATLNTAGNLAAGTYNVVAVYTGDLTYAASTSATQPVTINQAPTTTAVTASTSPVATGVADTLTATITVPNGTAPTGTVTFMDGATTLGKGTVSQVVVNHQGSPLITFVATLPATFSTIGSQSISAIYSGDTNFATSTGTATVDVVNSTTTTVTSSNPDPTAAPASSVILTATVASAGGTPTGTVQFYDNLIAIGSPVTLNGTGMGTTTISTALLQAASGSADLLTPGLHSISAVFTPDAAGAGTFFTSTGVYEQAVQAQPFGASDEFIFRVGDGTTPLIAQAPNPNAGQGSIGNTIFIDEYTPTGTLVQSIILPSVDGTGTQNAIHAIVADGQQSATGQLALSADGQYLFVTGYDSNPLLANAPLPHSTNSVPRSVARIKYDGSIQTIGFTAGSSGIQTSGNINGVYSPDGNQFYISGTAGVYYSSSFTPSAALQSPTKITSTTYTVTGLESDGANLDIVGTPNSGGVLVGAYTGFPTAAASAPTNLPGLPGADNFQLFPIDVFFTHLNGTNAPAGINTMYISDDGPSFAHGAITKWALVSGSWTMVDTVTAGTNNTAVSFYWLTGLADATGNVTLYSTYGNGGNSNTGPGYLYSITDTNGYNAPIGTGGTHSDAVATVASVGSTSAENFRGVAFAPKAVPVGPFSKFVVTAQADNSVVAGNPVVFTVQATDAAGNPITNYSGPTTVTITSTPADPQSNLPTTITLNSSGFGFVLANLKTVGSYALTASADTFSGTSSNITVTPGAATYFTVAAPPAATITQWTFSTVTAAPDNSPAPSTGLGTATVLGMDNNYTFSSGNTITGSGTFTPGTVIATGSTAAADVIATAGDPNGFDNAWRVRGPATNTGTGTGNGWSLSAPQYSQGAQFSTSTVGYDNVGFSFDWFSTTQGVKNLQVQYTTDGTTWTNIGSTYIAASNAFYPGAIHVDLSGISGASDDPNFGVRLVSAYDPTLSPPNYGSANGGQNGVYNNNSGNWRFADVTFTGTPITTVSTGAPFNVTVTAYDHFGNVATGYAGTVKLTSTDAAANLGNNYTFTTGTGKDNGVHVFSATLNTAGSPTITATDTTSTNPTITGTSSAITTRGLTVTSFTPTATGFTVTFSKPITVADINLYGGSQTSPLQDVTLVGTSSGTVNGSFVVDPSGTSATFKASSIFLSTFFQSSVLPDDTWTVTLISGTGTGATAHGFFDSLNAPLDGGNNAGHANYTTTFTSANSSKEALSIPDFARGPDGATTIAVPNNSAKGIPVTLSNVPVGSGATDAVFTLTYNPTLLTPTGAGTGDSSGTGSTFTMGTPVSVDATHSTVTFTWHNGTAQSGTVVLGDILANVPDSAANEYSGKEILGLGTIKVNNADFTGVWANGLHVNAYFGDVTGDGKITGLDIATAESVATGASLGLTAYKLIDPAAVGDIAGDGSIDATAVSDLASFTAKLPVPQIPAIPSNVTITPGGPDPTLSLASGSQAGGIVSVLLDHPHPVGSTGMEEAVLALTYDPKALTVSSSDITLGSIPGLGSGWHLVSVVDQATGQIGIDLYSTTAISATQAGSLVNIAFHVVPGAAMPATAVQLVNAVTPNGRFFSTEVADDQGQYVLSPGMDRLLVETNVSPVSSVTPVSMGNVVTTSVLHSQPESVAASVSEESAGSTPLPSAAEANDGLTIISNGSVPSEAAALHTVPVNLVVTSALAFQASAANQVIQITNLPVVNVVLAGTTPQQLMDRLFLAVARWAEAPADEAQDAFWDNAIRGQDWLAVHTPSVTAARTDDSVRAPEQQTVEQQAVSDRIAVLDEVFAQLADEADDFGDL